MGNRLSPDINKSTTTGTTGSGLLYGTCSMIGRRSTMEDSHCICDLPELPSHSVFAVFDGHGGAYVARYASCGLKSILTKQESYQEYVANFDENVRTPRKIVRLLERALEEAFVDMDREIYKHIQSNLAKSPTTSSSAPPAQKKDAGTTACVVVVTPHHIVCANAGDSRALLTKSEEKLVALSEDHRANHPKEEQRIKKAGGFVFGGRLEDDLMVTRGFGDYRYKDVKATLSGDSKRVHSQKVSPLPDIKVVARTPDQDQFLFCACDGIYDVRTNEKVRKDIHCLHYHNFFVHQHKMEDSGNTEDFDIDFPLHPLGMVCEDLLDQCLRKGSKDNMTAILVQLSTDETRLLDESMHAHSAKSERSMRFTPRNRQKRKEMFVTQNVAVAVN